MEVQLTPELEALVALKVESGKYASAADVVGEALLLLQAADREEAKKLADLRAAIAEGIAQADRGEAVPFDAAAVEEIKRLGRERLAKRLGQG